MSSATLLNGAAAGLGAALKTIRSVCRPCGLELSLQTTRELHIERLLAGGGLLLDGEDRVLCCPFCRAPLDGALYRKRT
jgi:hypothetical protein